MIRQNAVLALLVFAVTFFLVPFQALITFNGFARLMHEAQEMLEPSWYNDLSRNISNILISSNSQEALSFGFAGIGFISAYILFRHLFSRKQAILAASLPLRRQTDFLYRSAVYLICSFLPSAICLLLYPLFAHMTGFSAYMSMRPWMQIGVLLLMHLYGYAVGTLSAALTGQVWSCIGMSMILGMCAELSMVSWEQIAIRYLYTLPQDTAMPLIRAFSPAFSLYKTLGKPGIFTPWAGIIATVLFLALGYTAYLRRPAERAEHPVAFERLEMPLALILSLAGGGFCGYIFMNITNSEPVLIIAAVAGAILVWMLAQVIISLNYRRVFTKLPVGCACAAVLVLCLIGLRFDILGYDRYTPIPAKLSSIQVKADSGPENKENYTLSAEPTKEAAATLAVMLRDSSVGPRIFHDPMYKEMEMTFGKGLFQKRRGYSGLKNAAFTADPAAWTAAAATLVESDEYRAGIIAGANIDLLLNQIESGNGQNVAFSAWEQLYGNSGIAWDNYKSSAGLPRDWLNGLPTEQLKAVLTAAKTAINGRTIESVQKDPVYYLMLTARTSTGNVNSTLNIYPDEIEVISALLGDKGPEMARLLSGDYAKYTDCVVYKVAYDTPATDFFAETSSPVSWQRAESPEQAADWIRHSVNNGSTERYSSRPVSNEMLWIFYSDSSYEYYDSSLNTEITQDTDLVKLVLDNPDLEFWPARRYILTQQ